MGATSSVAAACEARCAVGGEAAAVNDGRATERVGAAKRAATDVEQPRAADDETDAATDGNAAGLAGAEMAAAAATYARSETKTVAPRTTPSVRSASTSAAVPLHVATPCSSPHMRGTSASKRLRYSPADPEMNVDLYASSR